MTELPAPDVTIDQPAGEVLTEADVDVEEVQVDELPDDPDDTALIEEHADAAVDSDTGADPDA